MPFVENFSEFKQRQNCEVIQIQQGDFTDAWQFANGAGCVMQKLGPTPTLLVSEPPTEKFALLRAKRVFVAAKLGKEARDYRAALADYQQQANYAARYPESCQPVAAGAVDSLRNGWDVVEKLRVELEQLDQQLAESPDGILNRQRRDLDQRDAALGAERQRTAAMFAGITSTGHPPKQDIVTEVAEYFRSNETLTPISGE